MQYSIRINIFDRKCLDQDTSGAHKHQNGSDTDGNQVKTGSSGLTSVFDQLSGHRTAGNFICLISKNQLVQGKMEYPCNVDKHLNIRKMLVILPM